MASENKLRKQKNSHAVPSILKNKGKGIKGMDFFTSAQRLYLKSLLWKDIHGLNSLMSATLEEEVKYHLG